MTSCMDAFLVSLFNCHVNNHPGYVPGGCLMSDEKSREIEEKIAEMKSRIPPHSIPPRMLEDMEELEEELERLKAS